MTCKDCIHCEVCIQLLDQIDNPTFTCAIFKDRSKFIELPRKVGDSGDITAEEVEQALKERNNAT